ncbi:MAG: hypothetical protein GWN00_37945, partial [Aliifodinibius sp.]|nr:hypothetical protein [candidate division KSB1 bacterium]NIT61780.1 hypothetical protein [Fodinibius sp.]NIV16386.1 hypothetical protein [Fodinibius sp.]NIY30360.1 hypothetical protein [Fodinibius sp.]
DLFDRTSYFFGGGLDFKFNRKISLSLDYVREIKNYRDIADPASQTLSSLDNIENNFEADVYFRPSKLIKVKLSYDGQDRLYQHKLARDGNGMRTPNTNRRYWTNLVDLNFYLLPRRASAKFSASVKQRKDRFSDYHDYLQTELEGSLELTMSMYSYLDFNIERSWKDYDKLEVSGSTLSNRYLTIEASIGFFMTRNVTLQAQYVHDRESSTADVFNYHRNIVLAKLRYSLD